MRSYGFFCIDLSRENIDAGAGSGWSGNRPYDYLIPRPRGDITRRDSVRGLVSAGLGRYAVEVNPWPLIVIEERAYHDRIRKVATSG